MGINLSRRKFLKTGLTLPAAGLVLTTGLKAASQEPPQAVYRTLGKTGLKVSGYRTFYCEHRRSYEPVF